MSLISSLVNHPAMFSWICSGFKPVGWREAKAQAQSRDGKMTGSSAGAFDALARWIRAWQRA